MDIKLLSDEYFMREALKQARIAFDEDEVPVGAIVVCNNHIIAKAYNQTEKLQDSTAHAEMIALTSAFNYLGSKYLTECTLYVTLEPCVMCAGALYWAQIGKLKYGAEDPQRGYTKVKKNILHPTTEVKAQILSEDCKQIVDKFFIKLRS